MPSLRRSSQVIRIFFFFFFGKDKDEKSIKNENETANIGELAVLFRKA